ncbi:MAG: YfhO family protein, partial [Clostridia bacterium]|nr:YfhO family protein [Clostridia bacterium]
VGVLYAYCGYTFVSNTYINWMDFLIYMPFCVKAFQHFVKTGKFLPFSILMSCCVYTCFSIACFSMFTVFPALVLYGIFCVEKERRNTFIAYLCLSFVVTILICLPILVPALAAYLGSARTGELFENLWYGFNKSVTGEGLGEFNSSNFLDRYSTSLYSKWSYILSDMFFVVLTIYWFVKKGLKNPFAQFMLIAGIMTLLPLVVDEAMNLMNMGSYMSYALRFGFLNAIYFLGGACLALDELCKAPAPITVSIALETEEITEDANAETTAVEIENEAPMSALNVNKPLLQEMKLGEIICTSVFVLVGVFSVLSLIWLGLANGYKTVWSWFTDDSSVLNSLNSFAGRFAHSLGGLEAIAWTCGVVAIITILGLIFLSLKKVNTKLVALVLVAVASVQVVFYNNTLVAGNLSTQHTGVAHYQNMMAVLNAEDESYFRVKDYNDKWTAPVPLAGDANSFSVFSSIIDEDNFATFQLFGYQGNGQNTFKSAHNTGKGNRSDEFGDSFMGYKYFFVYTDPNDEDATISEQIDKLIRKKPYLKKVMVKNEQGVEEQLHSGDFYVFENTIVFPLGYRVADGEYRFKTENSNSSTNRKINQAALYQFLRGEQLNAFTGSQYVNIKSATELSEYLWSKAAQVEVGAGKITARVTAEEGEALFLNFVASKGYKVTVNGKPAELIDNDLKFLSVNLEAGENEVIFTYHSPYMEYMGWSLLASIILLGGVWLIVTKTKFMQMMEVVITWAGKVLALAVVAFFMIFPTCVFLMKIFEWIKGLF